LYERENLGSKGHAEVNGITAGSFFGEELVGNTINGTHTALIADQDGSVEANPKGPRRVEPGDSAEEVCMRI